MAETDLKTKIKSGLGITGTYQDETLQVYIDEVKQFILDAGVHPKIVDNEVSAGCIMRGVADLWNYGSGNASLSEYFKMRLLQLKKVAKLFITQGTGTTIVVKRNDVTLTDEASLKYGDLITISVTGGTLTVNEKEFVSGNTYTVDGVVEVVSVHG